MGRWTFFLPLVVLIAFAGYLGLRAGRLPSETEIINRYAALYVAEAGAGAQMTDCAAIPHPDPTIRMTVMCQPPKGDAITYLVGPRGGLVARAGSEAEA
ncbi:hypothetical protein [Cognatiyoonia sp. IB215182]|uniref:hypothetical protein n=1 Tax=Cognatiyoonia sp. IB215182 TaxID=3097353 RepID=UPI002A100556|nr:hypothetical protein [Cognatiyoonia sp. IB215182]MDX8352355.1 hypothetical protein [Cognatiyoonia sp. IB215182]